MKHLSSFTFLILSLLTSSCSSLLSHFDGVYLVHAHSDPIKDAVKPDGFVITPEKIKNYIPITKYAWNIYADDEMYYLSSAIQNFSKTGDNSWNAKKNGIPIIGTSQEDVSKLDKALKDLNFQRFRSPSELRSAINN